VKGQRRARKQTLGMCEGKVSGDSYMRVAREVISFVYPSS
jgi:hypothetical protein